jgi:hypothetical protein
LFSAVNLFDLIVLDFLWFAYSPNAVIPGTEDLKAEYKKPGYHLKGFIRGCAIGLIVAAIAAALAALP